MLHALAFWVNSPYADSLIAKSRAQSTVQLQPYGQLISTRHGAGSGLPDGPVTRISSSQGSVLAVVGNKAFALKSGRWTEAGAALQISGPDGIMPGLKPGERITGWTETRNGDIWLTTTERAFHRKSGAWGKLDLPRSFKFNQQALNVDTEIRQVVSDKAGTIWLATSHGAIATDGDQWWQPFDRQDGMPFEDLNCLTIAANGDLWGGASQGAWRMRGGAFTYFHGKRWLPGNEVHSIAVEPGGAVWLGTDKGVAKIEERSMRLAEKAAQFEQITQSRHSREGWITGCGLKVAGDPSKGILPHASDNDGLWTAIYVAAEAFRYGATKDPQAREYGKKSMKALLDLVRLSGYKGFPARAIIRKGENVSGYDPNETVRVPGETDKIWYTSPVNKDLLIKGDCSSDELDGHYFAWYIYHELAADEVEKREIAAVVKDVSDNILSNNYTLIGHTGRKTLWGVFGPQFLNDDPRWESERGLNSIELLCYMKVAAYITKEERFAKAYEDLITRHHYLINTVRYRRGQLWNEINHSDDELAYCVYYPLLMLENDPGRRSILLRSISGTWLGVQGTPGLQHETSPFYNFIYGATTGLPCRTEDAVDFLQGHPWELIHWDVKNSHRHDITFRTGLGVTRRSEIDRVLPASERRVMRWNGNPWAPDNGGNGTEEEDGAAWLIGYWMGRYHGFIRE